MNKNLKISRYKIEIFGYFLQMHEYDNTKTSISQIFTSSKASLENGL